MVSILVLLCCLIVSSNTRIINLALKEVLRESYRCENNKQSLVSCSNMLTEEVVVPHPTECQLFYYCLHPYLPPVCRQCPGQLHFNPKLHVCDWPSEAECEEKSTKTETIWTSDIEITANWSLNAEYAVALASGTATWTLESNVFYAKKSDTSTKIWRTEINSSLTWTSKKTFPTAQATRHFLQHKDSTATHISDVGTLMTPEVVSAAKTMAEEKFSMIFPKNSTKSTVARKQKTGYTSKSMNTPSTYVIRTVSDAKLQTMNESTTIVPDLPVTSTTGTLESPVTLTTPTNSSTTLLSMKEPYFTMLLPETDHPVLLTQETDSSITLLPKTELHVRLTTGTRSPPTLLSKTNLPVTLTETPNSSKTSFQAEPPDTSTITTPTIIPENNETTGFANRAEIAMTLESNTESPLTLAPRTDSYSTNTPENRLTTLLTPWLFSHAQSNLSVALKGEHSDNFLGRLESSEIFTNTTSSAEPTILWATQTDNSVPLSSEGQDFTFSKKTQSETATSLENVSYFTSTSSPELPEVGFDTATVRNSDPTVAITQEVRLSKCSIALEAKMMQSIVDEKITTETPDQAFEMFAFPLSIQLSPESTLINTNTIVSTRPMETLVPNSETKGSSDDNESITNFSSTQKPYIDSLEVTPSIYIPMPSPIVVTNASWPDFKLISTSGSDQEYIAIEKISTASLDLKSEPTPKLHNNETGSLLLPKSPDIQQTVNNLFKSDSTVKADADVKANITSSVGNRHNAAEVNRSEETDSETDFQTESKKSLPYELKQSALRHEDTQKDTIRGKTRIEPETVTKLSLPEPRITTNHKSTAADFIPSYILNSMGQSTTELCRRDSESPFLCAKIRSPDSMLPHPQNCQLFYYCVHPYLPPTCRHCPANLHFNPVKHVCDWPASAGCDVTVTTIATDSYRD